MTVLRQFLAGLRVLLVLTVIVGVAYPLAMTAVGQVAFGSKADGSPVTADGEVVGSALIGQAFDGPEWFHPRPSAAGADGYDALASSGSNLGPNSADLTDQVTSRRASVAAQDGVPASSVPPDALTASGSGLDPHISPEYAYQQVARVARERGLEEATVRALVDEHTAGRTLGFLGEPRVNVLELNLALTRG